MPKIRRRDILFHIENEVQFESLKPLIEHIRDNTNITFDIVVPDDTSANTAINKKVHDGGAKLIKAQGFAITRSIDGAEMPDKIVNTEYKVLLSAYMYRWHYDHIKARYRIMFPYASYYFNKPQWTISSFIERDFMADALLSHAIGTQEACNIFTKTYIVPSLKLMDYKKKRNKNSKPTLLFAPTYNEIDFAENFIDCVNILKSTYKIAMRGHHRVVNLDSNKDISQRLYEQADIIYDMSEHSLSDTLGEVDIVLSDNSATIFDAIYCSVPVVLFSDDTNSLKYRDIDTIQSKLVSSGDVLWTNNPREIKKITDKTLSEEYQKKQEKVREKLFPGGFNVNPVEHWMSVLNRYLNDAVSEEYRLAKRYDVEYRLSIADGLLGANNRIAELDAQVLSQNTVLNQKNQIIQNEISPGIKTSLKRLMKAVYRKIYI